VNPRPDVAIESIDFEHGEDAGRHGTPVLFAITTGNAETP
jgi:hypothetical protein